MGAPTIRGHLLRLVAGAALPLVVALTWNIYDDFRHTVSSTEERLQTVARGMVTNVHSRVESVHRALDVLGAAEFSGELAPPRCQVVLESLVLSRLGGRRAFVTDAAGVTRCESEPDTLHLELDPASLVRDLSSRPFLLTAPVGSSAGAVGLVSVRLHGVDGGALHFVFALSALDPLVAAELPAQSRFGLFTTAGALLWRNEDPDHLVGTTPNTEQSRRILEARSGAQFEMQSMDGVHRYFVVRPVDGMPLIAFVGVPVEGVRGGPLRRAMEVSLLALLVVAGLVFMALSQAQRISRPIVALERVAHAVGKGDLAVRADTRGPVEIGAVARALNEMLDARQASERLLDQAIGGSPIGMTISNLEGQFLKVNRAFANLLGYTEAELCTRRAQDVAHPDNLKTDGPLFAALATGERTSFSGERRFVHRDGHAVWTQLDLAVVRDRAGLPQWIVSQVQDLAERKRFESASRLAVVGTLAAGAAHEINNPLTYVLSNLSWGREELERLAAKGQVTGAGEVLDALSDAHGGAQRVAAIVSGLKSFSRKSAQQKEPSDVGAAMRAALQLTRTQLEHQAELEVSIETAPPVLGIPGELEQVFVNLLVNAVQALPEGHADTQRITVRVQPRGAHVIAEVTDTGCGLSAEVRDHLFEPFFTTKPIGVGTGMGLPICHGIVASCGGVIEVDSEVGRGSTFRVVLPALEPKTAVAPAKKHAPAVPLPKDRTVLVLDDDALVVKALTRSLAPGPEVVSFTQPAEALAWLEAGHRVDLILCDVMMPELSGDLFQERVRALSPALADGIIFITGGAFTVGSTSFLERTKNVWVQKPVAVDELRRLVARALAGEMAAKG